MITRAVCIQIAFTGAPVLGLSLAKAGGKAWLRPAANGSRDDAPNHELSAPRIDKEKPNRITVSRCGTASF